MSPSPPPSDIQLTPEEIERLREVLDTWTTKNRMEKREEKEKLVDEFLRERGVDQGNYYAREFLRMKVTHWFSNNSPTKDARLPRALRTVWSGREVFYIRAQDEIAKRQQQLLDDHAFSAPIAALNHARSQLWAALSGDEQEEYERQADEWTADGPDKELKALVTEKRLADWVSSFIALLWDQAGAVSEISFYYLDRLMKMKWGRYDISMNWHRIDPKCPRFIDMFAQWEVDYLEKFAQYASATLLQKKPVATDTAKKPKRITMDPETVFELYPDGTPILPPISDERFKLQTQKEAAMRAFMSLHWSLASGIKDMRVPWGEIKDHPDEYFRPNDFPNVTVVEPTDMRVPSMRRWWERVLYLQETAVQDEDRFRFTHWWDGSERHPAKYEGPPVEKDPKKAALARRIRIATGPPKGAMEAWMGQPEQSGGEGSGTSGGPGSDTEGALGSVTGGAQNPGSGKARGTKTRPSKKRKAATAAAGEPTAPTHKGKGKAVATRPSKRARRGSVGSSVSARSSNAGSDGEQSPVLSSDDDPEEPEEIDLDGVVSGSDDDPPPPPPKTGKRPAPRRVPAVPPEPDAALVSDAKTKSPGWVGKDAARVWPFVYALTVDVNYRRALTRWRHCFARCENLKKGGPGPWLSWDSAHWGLPAAVVTNRKKLDDVFTWLRAHIPTLDSSSTDVQQWFLAVGLTMRDATTANDVDDSEDPPAVPNGGPQYLARTAFTFADISETLESLFEKLRGPAGEASDADQPATTPQDVRPQPSEDPQASFSQTPTVPTENPLSITSALTSLPPTTAIPRTRRSKAGPPGVPNPPTSTGSGGSSAEVEQQVNMEIDDAPQSISEGLVLNRRAPKVLRPRSKIVPEVPSNAPARHTRGKEKQGAVVAPTTGVALHTRRKEKERAGITQEMPAPATRRTSRRTAGRG